MSLNTGCKHKPLVYPDTVRVLQPISRQLNVVLYGIWRISYNLQIAAAGTAKVGIQIQISRLEWVTTCSNAQWMCVYVGYNEIASLSHRWCVAAASNALKADTIENREVIAPSSPKYPTKITKEPNMQHRVIVE